MLPDRLRKFESRYFFGTCSYDCLRDRRLP